jgi:HD superfamily phosphohydrolase
MKTIYDPLYGYIEVEQYLLDIIDTQEFQRLRDIKQLGCASYVFPSATHTRFEHSIGVSYLSGIFIKNIQKKQTELDITEDDIRRIKIAGLIHDLGHACYSHFFDHYFLSNIENPLKDHEERSIYLLKHMNLKYNLNLSDTDLDEIKMMILSKPSYGFKYQIVANELSGFDTDKLDYINRDCHHLGLTYKYDYTRILKQIKVIDDEICFPLKQLSNVYELFELRYKLHQQVYQHPVISCAEMMILDMFRNSELNEKKLEYITDIDKFIKLTDDFINYLNNVNTNEKFKEIYNDLKSRNLYKFIEDSDDPNLDIDHKYKLKIKINFGKGDKNPLDFITFYDKNGKVKADIKDQLILVPKQYQIIKYRYIK